MAVACYCGPERTYWSSWHAKEDLEVRDAVLQHRLAGFIYFFVPRVIFSR